MREGTCLPAWKFSPFFHGFHFAIAEVAREQVKGTAAKSRPGKPKRSERIGKIAMGGGQEEKTGAQPAFKFQNHGAVGDAELGREVEEGKTA